MRKGLARYLNSFQHKSGVIINNNPDFIYMKVTKAAGTSVLRHTLEKKKDYVSPFHLKDHREKTNLWFKNIDDAALDEYYIFSVVRNPFDRFLSLATYFNLSLDDLVDNFDDYCEKNSSLNHHAHLQSLCTHMPDDKPFCNRIAKVETIQSDMEKIFSELHLPQWKIPIENKTKHAPYKDAFTKKAKRFVEDKYRKDLELFEYSF